MRIKTTCINHRIKHLEPIYTIAVHKEILVSGGLNGEMKYWVDKGDFEFKLVKTLRKHSGTVVTLKFSKEGTFLASGGDDKKVMVFNQEKKVIYTVRHPADVTHVDFTGSNLLVSSDLDGNLFISSLEEMKVIAKIKKHQKAIVGLVCYENFLFTYSEGCLCFFEDLQLKKFVEFSLENPIVECMGAKMSFNGNFLSVGMQFNHRAHSVDIYNLNLDRVFSLVGHVAPVELTAFNGHSFLKDGTEFNLIACGSQDNSLSFWSTLSCKPFLLLKNFSSAPALDMVWLGNSLLVSTYDGLVKVITFDSSELGEISMRNTKETGLFFTMTNMKLSTVETGIKDSIKHEVPNRDKANVLIPPEDNKCLSDKKDDNKGMSDNNDDIKSVSDNKGISDKDVINDTIKGISDIGLINTKDININNTNINTKDININTKDSNINTKDINSNNININNKDINKGMGKSVNRKRIEVKSIPVKKTEKQAEFMLRETQPFCINVETNKLSDAHKVYSIEYKDSILTVYRHKIPLYTKIVPSPCRITFNANALVVYANNYIRIYNLHKGTLSHPLVYSELSWIEVVGSKMVVVGVDGSVQVYEMDKGYGLKLSTSLKLPKTGAFTDITVVNAIPLVKYEEETFFYRGGWISLNPLFEKSLLGDEGLVVESMDEVEALINVNRYLFENSVKILPLEQIVENVFYYSRKFIGILVNNKFVEPALEYKVKEVLSFFIEAEMPREFCYLLQQLNTVGGFQKVVVEMDEEMRKKMRR